MSYIEMNMWKSCWQRDSTRSSDVFIEGTEEGQFSIAHFRCVLDGGRLVPSHGNGRRGQLDGRAGKSVGDQMRNG